MASKLKLIKIGIGSNLYILVLKSFPQLCVFVPNSKELTFSLRFSPNTKSNP